MSCLALFRVAFTLSATCAVANASNIPFTVDPVVDMIVAKKVKACPEVVSVSGTDFSGKERVAQAIADGLVAKGLKTAILDLKAYRVPTSQCLQDINPGKFFYCHEVDFNTLKHGIMDPVHGKRAVHFEGRLSPYATANQKIDVTPCDVLLVVGSMLARKTVRPWFDVNIYVDCSQLTSRERASESLPSTQIKELELVQWMAGHQLQIIDEPKKGCDYIVRADSKLDNAHDVIVEEHFDGARWHEKLQWLYPPDHFVMGKDGLSFEPGGVTDFWQRTLYGFRNDNAPFLYTPCDSDFVMEAKVRFQPKHEFDQAGICIRLDEDNWIKAGIEYELNEPAKLGSVVTNMGYSDWATTPVTSEVQEATYRVKRMGQDYLISYLNGGGEWTQLRVCHLAKPHTKVMVGLYACSPIASGYKVQFASFKLVKDIQ